MATMLAYDVNCSMLFTELPLLQRPDAARRAGFDAVEFWWPWPDQPVPPDAEVEAFIAAIRDAGVQLVGLNFYAGDLAGPDAGAVSVPSMSDAFRANVPVAVAIGQALDVRAFNALYGVRVDDRSPREQDELAQENLAIAASAADAIGARVLVEPVSGPKPYPLRTAADVVRVLDRLGAGNAGLLADLYHLTMNGDDVAGAIDRFSERIGHVQVADTPGRGEPGSGELDIDRLLSQLATVGYDGWVGLEYKPTRSTEDSLGWLPPTSRGRGTRPPFTPGVQT